MLAVPWDGIRRHVLRGLFWSVAPMVVAGATLEAAPESKGRMIQLMANGFSFRVLEPADWTLDLRSAPQLAAFIIHPDGLDWRKSQTVIYANFLPTEDKTLTEFLDADRERFREDCPEESSPGESSRALGLFIVQKYSCAGLRNEIMAAAEVGDFHFVLLLTTEKPSDLEAATAVFEKVVTSFTWSRRP